MSPQAQLVMLLWLPVIFYLFSRYPSQKAILLSFIGGLLFLPQRAGFKLPLIPDYEGMVATCYGILIATFIYDSQRFNDFKWQWIDLPMVCWCICPMFSSLTNDLGAYDGFNGALEQTAVWGLPYLLGRLYLGNLDGLKELALTMLKGGIIYTPLCLYEIKMSPVFHLIIYGYYAHPSGNSQASRGSTWRPSVFMEHGLLVAMFMFTVTLIAIWLWQSKTVKEIWGQSIQTWSIILVLTFVLMKSSGSYGYLIYGLIILFVAKFVKSNIPLFLLIFIIVYYLYLGVTGNFDGEGLVDWISKTYSPDRAYSLGYRLKNEEVLRVKAQERMLFGWGGWGRNRIYEYNWRGELVDVSVTDSLWIIVFGINGVFGLVSITTSLLLPVVVFAQFRYPPKTWFHPKVAPSAVLAVCLSLFMLDCLLNVTTNPTFPLICGGISGLVVKEPESLTSENKVSKKSVLKKLANRGFARRQAFPKKRFFGNRPPRLS